MTRQEKNKQISESMRLTKMKRSSQICKSFKFKIDKSHLNNSQKEDIKMLLVEAKWIYNYILANDNVYSVSDKDLKTITHKDKNGIDIPVTLKYISASRYAPDLLSKLAV